MPANANLPPASCRGERCVQVVNGATCNGQAFYKIAEECLTLRPDDEPRHGYSQYVCKACFRRIMQPYLVGIVTADANPPPEPSGEEPTSATTLATWESRLFVGGWLTKPEQDALMRHVRAQAAEIAALKRERDEITGEASVYEGALNDIATAAGCPQWDYAAQVVRDVEGLAKRAVKAERERDEAQANLADWNLLATLDEQTARHRDRAEQAEADLARVREERDAARAEIAANHERNGLKKARFRREWGAEAAFNFGALEARLDAYKEAYDALYQEAAARGWTAPPVVVESADDRANRGGPTPLGGERLPTDNESYARGKARGAGFLLSGALKQKAAAESQLASLRGVVAGLVGALREIEGMKPIKGYSTRWNMAVKKAGDIARAALDAAEKAIDK